MKLVSPIATKPMKGKYVKRLLRKKGYTKKTGREKDFINYNLQNVLLALSKDI